MCWPCSSQNDDGAAVADNAPQVDMVAARRGLAVDADAMNGGQPQLMPCRQGGPAPPPPPPRRFRVRVLLFQNTGHAIVGANVAIDGAGAVASDAHGRTGWTPRSANGRHTIRIPAPADVQYLECACAACQAGTPLRYWPWADAEYLEQDIDGFDDTVDVYVDQVVRVKVGYPNQDSVPGDTTVDRTWVLFYLPETKGARADQGSGFQTWLGMTTNVGAVAYFGANPGGAAAQQGAAFDFVLGPQAAGWQFARMVGGGAGPAQVSVRLTEQAYSREAPDFDAAPLIPWTFYFWPTPAGVNSTSTPPQAGAVIFSPLWAFDVWAGADPTTPASAFGWESDPAHGHHDTAGAWSGHCNQAATASIIFREPQADIDWNWQDAARGNLQLQLNSEGLKVLATEFAGHRVQTETLFTIFPGMVEGAPQAEQAKLIPELNGLDPNRVRRKFAQRGTYAAKFFAAMQAELGANGEPLLTDVRAPAGVGAGAMNQVWNQAIYLYRAYYKEHPQPVDGDAEERRAQDLQVTLMVYWNEDYNPTYGAGKATAAVVDNGGGSFTVTPRELDGRNLSLWRKMQLRLQFSNAGRLNAADARNDVESSTGRNDAAFYLLRYLQKITQVTANTVSEAGNPYVNDNIFGLQNDAAQQIMNLRARYPIA